MVNYLGCPINYLFIDWNPIYKDDAEHFIPDYEQPIN